MKKIDFIVVYDTGTGEYRTSSVLVKDLFDEDGRCTAVPEYIYISSHTVEFEPLDKDRALSAQLAALGEQEKELDAQYTAAKTELQTKRQNLLAITYEGGQPCPARHA